MPLPAAPRRRVHAPISPTPNLAPWQRTAKRLWRGGGRVRAATPSEKRQPTLTPLLHPHANAVNVAGGVAARQRAHSR